MRFKLLSLILSFTIVLPIFLSGQCGGTTLRSQTDVNNYLTGGNSGCTEINGDLHISDNNDDIDNIVDLTPLQTITSCTGFINIFGNNSLLNLNGLDGLTSIGSIDVRGNSVLQDIDALSNITSVGTKVSIHSNASLLTIDGLSGLSSIPGDLFIVSNPNLIHIEGLSSITSISGSFFSIIGNTSLSNLDGLEMLTTVNGTLTLSNNTALLDIEALSNLNTLNGRLSINSNNNLDNLYGLRNVTNFNGSEISIVSCPQLNKLTDFCGLFNMLNGFNGTFFRVLNGINPTKQEIIDYGPCQQQSYQIGDLKFLYLEDALAHGGSPISVISNPTEIVGPTIPNGIHLILPATKSLTFNISAPQLQNNGTITNNGLLQLNNNKTLLNNVSGLYRGNGSLSGSFINKGMVSPGN